MDLDTNDHALNKEDEAPDRGVEQDTTSFDTSSRNGNDTERLEEDSAFQPCIQIEIAAPTSAGESSDNEKEQYISERHAMITGILKAGATLPMPDMTMAALSMTATGTQRTPVAPVVVETEKAAAPAKEPHTMENGALHEPTVLDHNTTLLFDNDTNSPGTSDKESNAAPFLVDEKDASIVGPPRKARRTNPIYINQQPGAFPVEGLHAATGELHGRTSSTNNRSSGDATPTPSTVVVTESHNNNNNESMDLERGMIAAACETNNSTQTGFTAAVSSDLSILGETALEAVAVSPEEEAEKKAQMEQEIRRQIYEEAIPAQVMGQDNMNGTIADGGQVGSSAEGVNNQVPRKRKTLCWIVGMVLLAIVVGTGLGLGLTKKSKSKTATATLLGDGLGGNTDIDAQFFNLSTLEQVRKRGFIRCGVTEFGFINIYNTEDDSQPAFEGFNVEQCRTMALAALGDPDKYEIVLCDHYTRFSFLTNHTIDIMTEAATHTMERDVWVDTFQAGYTFTVPYFYSGLTYAGNPAFVDCADESDSFIGICRNLKICVLDGSTHVAILGDLIQGSAIVPYNGTESLLDHLWKETCNVIAGEPLYLVGVKNLFLEGFSGENVDNSAWKIGSSVVSREPLAMVTRDDDPEWSTLANMVVNGLILAEKNGISTDNAQEMLPLFANGSELADNIEAREPLAPMLVSLIAEFGNFGDLYHAHIESQIPRNGALNRPYGKNASTGLLYSIPSGNLLGNGPEPLVNRTLDIIHQRGHIICGVSSTRGPAFAREVLNNTSFSMLEEESSDTTVWVGFDVEFCRALSGSLFLGDKTRVVFVSLDRIESFNALTNGEVDVVAGARITLQANYFESTTRRGYEFSPPYYYDNDTKDAFAFMTREDDVQWNSFVYWIVMATFFAEEEGITMDTAVDMPVVTLFGERLKQMYRDCISSVGSYAEIYNNTLQEFIPRDGANRLNEDLAGPQMFPIPAV